MNKKIGLLLFLVIFVTIFSPFKSLAYEKDFSAEIFYNRACAGCEDYIRDLSKFFSENRIELTAKKDYIAQKSTRAEMNEINEQEGVPPELFGHMMTFIKHNGKVKIILSGHVPENIILDLLKDENQKKYEKIIVFQDIMHGEIKNYKVWGFLGPQKEYLISTPVLEYLNWFEKNKAEFKKEAPKILPSNYKTLLPTVALAGLLDGINPCAFAVMIFFIAFLFTLRRTFKNILFLGLVYIAVIYLTYLGIGFGIFKAIVLFDQPHFMAKLGSWLLIFLGVINLKSYFFPKLPGKLQIPKFSQETLKKWLTRATLPAVIIAAFLVGLCVFPCSGGIYVAVISLLAAKTTFFWGLLYLLFYNLLFVLPLFVILFLSSNKLVLVRAAELEKRNEKLMRLLSGLAMILLGAIILIFFV
ncbi:MAG: cytochrome c biogenesis protein CcdA [Patescibacteria group bacterium]